MDSVTPNQGGNGEDLEEVEQRLEDEVEVIKKRKGSPLKSPSRKKSKATVTKMQTTLTLDDFSFLLATMNEAIEERTKRSKRSRSRYIIGLKLGSKKCSRHSNIAAQSLLCVCQKEQKKWEKNQFNSARLLIQSKYAFDTHRKKKRRLLRP
jgi:hypothetical protein